MQKCGLIFESSNYQIMNLFLTFAKICNDENENINIAAVTFDDNSRNELVCNPGSKHWNP